MVTSVKSVFVVVGVAAAIATVACSNVLGIEDTTLEEEGETPPEGRDWRCVGNVPIPTQSQPIEIRAMVTDFNGLPFAGLTINACAVAANPNCDTPIASAQSAADGTATLAIPANVVPFTGYLRLEGDDDRVPYVSYYSRPIATTLEDPIPFLSVTWEELDAAIPGSTHLDGRGHLFINATDCQNVDAPGIRFEIKTPGIVDGQSVPFYVTTSGFSADATQTIGGPQVGGRGGVFNLVASDPPALVRFEAISEGTGGVTATADWWIFPDTLTTGRLLPQ